jgi:mannose-6-phosphate isomerase-like protein (cupin superfamily)
MPNVAPVGYRRRVMPAHTLHDLLRAQPSMLLLLAACATQPSSHHEKPESPASVLDARLPDGRRHQALAALADAFEVPDGENIVARELGRDRDTSHHLVAVRDREPLHRHDKSALTVVVLKGQGRMLIEGEERPVAEGSILYVPRATVHAFINQPGSEPAVAYVVFSPPFDPEDRVPADAAPAIDP